jgi:hypothetical protein
MTGHQAAQIAEDAARTLETLAVRIGAPDADNDALRNAARRHIHDLEYLATRLHLIPGDGEMEGGA